VACTSLHKLQQESCSFTDAPCARRSAPAYSNSFSTLWGSIWILFLNYQSLTDTITSNYISHSHSLLSLVLASALGIVVYSDTRTQRKPGDKPAQSKRNLSFSDFIYHLLSLTSHLWIYAGMGHPPPVKQHNWHTSFWLCICSKVQCARQHVKSNVL